MDWLDTLRKKLQEHKIRKTIAGHSVRNDQLRGVLLSYGVALGKPRTIDLHFWAPREEKARALESGLKERGYAITVCQPCSGESAAGLWNVEATAELTPSLPLSEGFTEEMVRLAVSAGAEYDGWGTPITEAAREPTEPAGAHGILATSREAVLHYRGKSERRFLRFS